MNRTTSNKPPNLISPFSAEPQSAQAADTVAAPAHFPPVRKTIRGAAAAFIREDRNAQRENRLENHDVLGEGVTAAEGTETQQPGKGEDAEEMLVEADQQAQLEEEEEQERV